MTPKLMVCALKTSNRIFAIWLALTYVVSVQAADRPNVLWLSCEDISSHIGCFGDPHAITPNIDQLATEGVRYTNVFTAAGVCAPCRSTIITGMYQNSIGTHHMRCNAVLPKWLKPFPLLLREAGYYCTNNSKTDYQFKNPKASDIWDESSRKAHWKNRKVSQPFFSVFNFTGCHESGIAGVDKYRSVTEVLTSEQRQDAGSLTTFPPYYPDTPRAREDWKRNYELITAMDHWAGEHIAALKEAGLYDETIIVFWSDHGVGLPRAKRWLYDSGTRIPFVVRVPEKFRTGGQGAPGTINTELVNSTDFAPTTLNLAGIQVPEYMQGRAFLGESLGTERDFVYGARDRMDERYDIIRAVRDRRWRYVRNFEPLKPYYQYMNTPEKGATMQEIRLAEKAGTLPPLAKQFSLASKPVEELYDLETDPHEVHNLAGLPEHAERLKRMREACLAWQKDVMDIGLVPEAEIVLREESAGSRYDVLHEQATADTVESLVDIAAKASEASAIDELARALAAQDAAVRYWGATGLGNFAQQIKGKHVAALGQSLADSSPSVRIAAARALCRQGSLDRGLPVLENELKSKHEWGRLAAAIALDELDEGARPSLPALQAALENQPNKYIVRVANKAVNDLLGTNHRVP